MHKIVFFGFCFFFLIAFKLRARAEIAGLCFPLFGARALSLSMYVLRVWGENDQISWQISECCDYVRS